MLPNKIHRFDDPILDRQIEALCFTTREGWADELADFTQAKVPGSFTSPTWSAYSGNVYAWRFANNLDNGLQLSYHIGHSYKPGSDVYPHVHFSATGGGTGVVRWILELIPMRSYGQLAAIPSTITMTIDFDVQADSPHILAEATDAQSFDTELEPDSIVMCVIHRDTSVANNYTGGNIFGLYADLHYEVDRFSTPDKNLPFYDTLLP